MLRKSMNNKNERNKLWQTIWTIVTTVALILGGMTIATYMAMSEKISMGSENTIANITVFVSTLAAMLTQINREGKLWRSGLYVLGLITLFVLADFMFYDGVAPMLWQRLCAMMISISLFVIITSRKGNKRFRKRGYAG